MNKQRYRIIFNQARGLLMAVAEYVSSKNKSVSAASFESVFLPFMANLSKLRFSVLLAIGSAAIFPLPLQAGGIVADPTAPTNQQPHVSQTASGLPLVNIQTPSAAGVSRNTYQQFDIRQQGAILNNSRTNVQTQLGGWVQGNPLLANGTARVILNEVNSSNPSILNGFIEIAGSKAQLVIANPAGISCDGCGFINANRATLTTGTPIVNSGNLLGYRVGGGTISFLGRGMDASQTNYVDVIARAVEVNAGIWASQLNLVAGANQVNTDSNGTITSITPMAPPSGSAPEFTLDVATLGGMYAGKIHLVGTEAGLGVRNAGSIGASAGEVSIDVNGRLTNLASGRITSHQNIRLQATQDLQNQGLIYAGGNANVTTQGNLTNTDTIAANGNVTVNANGANSSISSSANSVLAAGLNANGTLGSTSNLTAAASQSITALGQNLAGLDQTLIAQSLDLTGSQTIGRNLTFTASNGDLDTTSTSISATGALSASTTQTLITDNAEVSVIQLNVAAHDLSNVAGELIQTGAGDSTINLAGSLNNTQGRIATNSANLALGAQTFTNTNGIIEHAGDGTFIINAITLDGARGTLASNGNLDLAAQTATLDAGRTIATQINIDTATLSNRAGEIIQSGTGNSTIVASTHFDNTAGTLASNGSTLLMVNNLINQGGSIQAAGASDLTINASGFVDNTATGLITANGLLSINADQLLNTSGEITAAKSLTATVTQAFDNSQGRLLANQDVTLTAASIDNSQGTMASVQANLLATATNDVINNDGGHLQAAQDINLTGDGLSNNEGGISGFDVNLNSGTHALDNTRGNITALGTLDSKSGQMTNDAGLIQAMGSMALNTQDQALININSGTTGGIIGQSTVTLTTGDLNNQSGFIGAKGDLIANSAAITNTQAGIITSESAISLTGTALDNRGGQIEALGNLTVNTGSGAVNNNGNNSTASLMRAGEILAITASSVTNANTQVVINSVNQGLEGESVAITTDTLNNTSGAIRANTALTLSGHGAINNTQGLISSGNTLNLTDSNLAARALAITNTSGTLIANGGLQINSKSLTGDGKVLSQGDLTVDLTSNYTQTSTGELQADGDFSVTTTGNVINQSAILAGNTLALQAANISNAATGEIGGLDTHINVSGTLTNRGLIDGGDTFITAGTLNNIGTGSIFGDHVAIAANTLINQAETVNSVTSSAVIAARNELDIGAQTITNQNNSLLFSSGDLAIGGNLDNHQASVAIGVSQVATLTNRNAIIEALGDLSANVSNLQNLNAGITTRTVYVGSTYYDQFTPRGTSVVLNSADYPGAQIGNFNISTRTAGPYSFREYWRYVYIGNTYNTAVQTSLPGQLLSGGDMTLNGNVTNRDSKIIAGGSLNVNGGTLSNQNTQGQSTTSYSGTAYYYDYDGNESCGDSGDGCYDISASAYNPGTSVSTFNLPTSQVRTRTAPTGTGTQIAALTTGSVNQTALGAASADVQVSPIATIPVITTVVTSTTVNAQSVNSVVGTASPNTVFPSNSLFQTNPDPGRGYLIETNPRFANYKTWLSSDYMLNQLSYDPATQTKRLGDGFYEQRLIREQIANLTGKRFLAGYSSDEAQYQALMANGVTFAKAFNLTPGIALSDLQMAQLTTDIVWLVEQTITLPDGSTTRALVPQVYARLQDGDLHNTGALLAGNSVNINLTGDLTNAGTMGSRDLKVLTADNINNLGGRIAANDVALNAQRDINNLGGNIAAQSSLTLNAGRNVNVVSTTQSSQNQIGAGFFSRTNLDRVAGLYVEGGQGLMVVNAGNNLQLDAAELINAAPTADGTGQTLLKAGNNLNLGTVQIAEQNNSVRNAKNYLKHGSTQEVGTTIQTEGDITLVAGNNLTTKAATVTSNDGDIQGIAGQDINIESGEATSNMDAARYKKKSGTFSSKKTTTRDTFNSTTSVGSALSAENITLVAGAAIAGDGSVSTQGQGNLNVIGSSVVATNDVNLNAGADINILASQNTHDETHYKKVKQSGLSTSGASVTFGSSQLTTTNDSQQVTNTASTVGSVEGNVTINSGKTYTQTGSDVLTPAGDIDIKAQQVNITAATDTHDSQQTMKYKQSGVTLAISNPVISAIQTVDQMRQSASETSDSRMKVLAAATAALSVNNAYEAVQAGQGTTINGKEGQIATGQDTAGKPTSRDANAADQVGGINVSISIGSSKSKSSTTQTSSTATSSNVTAGGNVNITATGAGEASDINVIGSKIKATDDLTLKADDQINLIAAQNVDTLKSKNNGSSASIGVSFGTDGLLFTASASGSKGKAKGNGTTWTETQIESGNQEGDTLKLESGTDTNIIGSQVAGNQVIADVGTDGAGNLNIQSLQDTNQYKDKQQSIGGSVSVGYGKMGGSFNYSDSKTKSNYSSVNEQAGILAGDDGFQINVAGNTNLTGAVIASTKQAIQDDKNTLSTETLTVSDIKNKAEYEASSTSIGGGYSSGGALVGKDQQGDAQTGDAKVPGTTLPSLNGFSATLPVALNASGNDDSTTVSAISYGTITITNDREQQAKTGKDAVTTVATLNRDVHVDANGNAVDSQGNSTANTLTPIYNDEVRAEINAGFEIVRALTNETGTFLANRAREADKKIQQARNAEELAQDPTNDLSDEQRQILRDQAIKLRGEAAEINNDWGAGGTYRQITTALMAAASGNITGTNAEFINNMVVNYVQQQGATYIGKLVAEGALTEGSPLHAALHALLACGGAAASGQGCSAGAPGAAASSLLTGLFSETSADETSEQREAKRNLIISLVTGIAALTDVDAATATSAAIVSVDNNWLATQQIVQMKKEVAQANTLLEKVQIQAKWAATGMRQDALTAAGVGKGLAESGWNDIQGMYEFLKDPISGLNGIKALISDEKARIALGDSLFQELDTKIDTMKTALEQGGDGNAVQLGENLGSLLWQVGSVLTGAGGVAKAGTKLASLGVDVATNTLEVMSGVAKFDKHITAGVIGSDGKALMDFSQLTRVQKSVIGEMLGSELMKIALPPGAEKIGRSVSVGQTGIDDLYKVGDSYVVVEYKFGTSELKKTNDGFQMSDDWLVGTKTDYNRILESVGKDRASDVRNALDKGQVEKWVVHTDPAGGTSIWMVDKAGKIIKTDSTITSKILGSTR